MNTLLNTSLTDMQVNTEISFMYAVTQYKAPRRNWGGIKSFPSSWKQILPNEGMKGGEKSMYWITGILGLVLLVAPFVLGYSQNSAAMWTSLLIGVGAITISFFEAVAGDKGRWEYWLAALLGIGGVTAPFVLGFGSLTIATWMSVGVGFMLALIASSKLYYDQTTES